MYFPKLVPRLEPVRVGITGSSLSAKFFFGRYRGLSWAARRVVHFVVWQVREASWWPEGELTECSE